MPIQDENAALIVGKKIGVSQYILFRVKKKRENLAVLLK